MGIIFVSLISFFVSPPPPFFSSFEGRWKVGYDAPSNSLRNPKVSTKVKQQKKKKVEACSLIRNTLELREHARVLK
jgi:hypothetical protein